MCNARAWRQERPSNPRRSGPVGEPSRRGRIDPERDRAVVDELDVHVLSERSAANGGATGLQRPRERLDPVRRDRVDVSAEGTFELRGLFAERAIQVIGVPDGWEVQRILRGKTPIRSLSTVAGETIDDLTIVITRQ